MPSTVEILIEEENTSASTKKALVDFIKDFIKKEGNGYGSVYSYLQQRSYNGSDEKLTISQLSVFCRQIVDLMLKYYGDDLPEELRDFKKIYNTLKPHEMKQKALLAFNFFFANPESENYPFATWINYDGFAFAPGRNFSWAQSDIRYTVTEEDLDKTWPEDFLHFWPFSEVPSATKRIYINTTPEYSMKITLELFKKCSKYKGDIRYSLPYTKFYTKDCRNDPMLVYCNERNFETILTLISQIYEEHPEWFQGHCNLPLTAQIKSSKTGKCIVGIADEPTIKGTSFNSLFTGRVIEQFLSDLRKKYGYNLGNLSNAELDKLVTYENIRPYIENNTCFSGDYPFFNKETVKRAHEKSANRKTT